MADSHCLDLTEISINIIHTLLSELSHNDTLKKCCPTLVKNDNNLHVCTRLVTQPSDVPAC